MANRFVTKAVGRVSTKVPGLRRLPILKLLAIAEIALIARTHYELLELEDRRRFVELVKLARGKPSNLTLAQRDEFQALVAKAEPRLFAGLVADKLSPIPLPKRIVEGPRKRGAQRPR